ncbi:hypothetical protein HDR63_03180 [bacterium]|nr:hypothetical protein [bacterium]
MTVKLSDFLYQYFRQLHFNNMPMEIRAQFDAFVKAEDFGGHMKSWRDQLMDKSLPDAMELGGDWELSREEWQNFFLAIQHAFQAMAANRSSFKDNDKAIAFLDEWFGPDKLFSTTQANDAAEQQIAVLIRLLQRQRNLMILKLREWGLTDADFSYDDLLKGLIGKKYNTDITFQERLKNVAQYITSYANYDLVFQKQLGQNEQDFSAIENGFDDKHIPPEKMGDFQAWFPSILNQIYRTDKIRDVFAEYDKGKIIKPLTAARENVAYDKEDSPDFVPPKRTDDLNFVQQVKKWWGDTYSDNLEKFVKLRGDRLYFSPSSKQIVGALDAVKIKPTDGLAAILDKAKDIQDKLKYKPGAAKDFEYFVKVMTELKTTMPMAFAGALYNANQRRALMEEFIIRAVRDGKESAAKVAMEIVSVIRYSWTTSKVMDALRKEDFKFLSDPSLSWNKNEGMQFVTNAIDKSIRTAFLGVGYGVTILRNAIMNTGDKFGGKSARIGAAATRGDETNAARRDELAAINDRNRARLDTLEQNLATAQAEMDAAENDMNAARQNRGDAQKNLHSVQARNIDLRQQLNNPGPDPEQQLLVQTQLKIKRLEHELELAETEYQYEFSRHNIASLTRHLNEVKSGVTANGTPLNLTPAERKQEIRRLNGELKNAERAQKKTHQKLMTLQGNQLGGVPVTKNIALSQRQLTDLRDARDAKKRELDAAQNELPQIQSRIAARQAQNVAAAQSGLANNRIFTDAAQHDYKQAKNEYLTAQDNYRDKCAAFAAAQDEIDALRRQIEQRDKELEELSTPEMDKYMELMAHWDFLETGRNVRSWALSKKRAQEKLDEKIEQADGTKVAQRDLILKNYYDEYKNRAA